MDNDQSVIQQRSSDSTEFGAEFETAALFNDSNVTDMDSKPAATIIPEGLQRLFLLQQFRK